jgi:hypothetical protein
VSAVAEAYPRLAAVLPVDAGGEKRNRALRAVASYLDEGREQVTLREIAERARLEDPGRLWHLLPRLERDGLLVAEWSKSGKSARFGVLP